MRFAIYGVMTHLEKAEIRELSKKTAELRKLSPGKACSWCHHTTIHNRRVAPIALVDWHKYADHGICIECSVEQVRQARARKEAQKETTNVSR